MSEVVLLEQNVAALRANPKTLALRVSREHYLFLAEQIEWLTNALNRERKAANGGWRCFHCGGVFTTLAEAEKHFGPRHGH